MKVAVTGGSGQLGTLLLRRLADDPDIREIVSLDLRPPRVESSKLIAVECDVRAPDIGRHFGGCDAVVHLAFIVVRHLPRQVFDDINIGGSRNVFRAAVAAGVRQLVYASSVAAYGIVPGHPEPITEDTPRRYQPEFPYPAAKYQVEAFLDELEREHPHLVVARLRPTILFGTRMEHALGQSLYRRVLPDGGGGPLAIVWDEDVADAFLLALKRRARGAFILNAEPQSTPEELARAAGFRRARTPPRLRRLAPAVLGLLARSGLYRGVDPAWLRHSGVRIIASSARARTVLGWQPKFPTGLDVIRHLAELLPQR